MKGCNKTLQRKRFKDRASLKEWSRMLHGWWKRDVVEKMKFEKGGECLGGIKEERVKAG